MKKLESRAKYKFNMNLRLLTITFTVFALIITLKSSLLQKSFFIPMQLVLAIPLLMSSTYARSKLAHGTKKKLVWEKFGFVTFLTGYALLINVIGDLIFITIGTYFGLIFLFFNILMSLIYSAFEIVEDKKKISSRLIKDTFFILLLLIGGILPILRVF